MSDKDPNLYYEVFNQRAGILTFFGALGGSVRAVALKTGWKEGLRVIFVGGTVAFGVGIFAPVLLKPWVGEIPDDMLGALGTLTAASFVIGLVAVTLVERFVSGPTDHFDKAHNRGNNRNYYGGGSGYRQHDMYDDNRDTPFTETPYED